MSEINARHTLASNKDLLYCLWPAKADRRLRNLDKKLNTKSPIYVVMSTSTIFQILLSAVPSVVTLHPYMVGFHMVFQSVLIHKYLLAINAVKIFVFGVQSGHVRFDVSGKLGGVIANLTEPSYAIAISSLFH